MTVTNLPLTGSVSLITTGNVTLAEAATYTGTTTLKSGTLTVTGSIGSAATPSGSIDIQPTAGLTVAGSGSVNMAQPSPRIMAH